MINIKKVLSTLSNQQRWKKLLEPMRDELMKTSNPNKWRLLRRLQRKCTAEVIKNLSGSFKLNRLAEDELCDESEDE